MCKIFWIVFCRTLYDSLKTFYFSLDFYWVHCDYLIIVILSIKLM